MILFQLCLLRSSYQTELEGFFIRLAADGSKQLKASDSAFCQARKKFSADAFVALNELCINEFYKTKKPRTWHGFHLFAIDGSTAHLNGVDADCRRYLDPEADTRGRRCTLARLSQCYDVLNHLSVAATLAPYAVGERALAWRHVENCATEKTLFLLDSGYPAFWMFSAIIKKGAQFCARIPADTWTALLGEFLESDLREQIITFTPNDKMKADCLERGIPCEPLILRAIKVELNTGETEVLLTTLVDSRKWPIDLFASLYEKRWGVESNYNHVKSRVELEQLSGKSLLALKQDFHARILLANLADLFAHQAQPLVKSATTNCKHSYNVNRIRALAKFRKTVVELFHSKGLHLKIRNLIESMTLKPCPVRPGRIYPRNFGPQRIYAFAYKPVS